MAAAWFPEFEDWNDSFKKRSEEYQDNAIAAEVAIPEDNLGNFYLCIFKQAQRKSR